MAVKPPGVVKKAAQVAPVRAWVALVGEGVPVLEGSAARTAEGGSSGRRPRAAEAQRRCAATRPPATEAGAAVACPASSARHHLPARTHRRLHLHPGRLHGCCFERAARAWQFVALVGHRSAAGKPGQACVGANGDGQLGDQRWGAGTRATITSISNRRAGTERMSCLLPLANSPPLLSRVLQASLRPPACDQLPFACGDSYHKLPLAGPSHLAGHGLEAPRAPRAPMMCTAEAGTAWERLMW